MGVLNVTPDSFSDGGLFIDAAAAIARGHEMLAEGAAVVDVGGESSRPGARPVDEDEEIRRVIPVIAELAMAGRVSIDTTKPGVARAAVDAGATLINDISATLAPVAAECGVGWVAMHMQGTPLTMQKAPRYGDVVGEVADFLVTRAEQGAALGVPEIWIDPGIGFGKTAADNLLLLRHLDRIVDTGWPVMVGTSRKSFLGRILAGSDAGARSPVGAGGLPTELPVVPPDDRLDGSLATATWAMSRGVGMVRSHDVLATAQATKVVGA